MRVVFACPVATCAKNGSCNGIGSCLKCGCFLIAKPSPRRKTLDLRDRGPVWRWHAADDGPSTIMLYGVELDEHAQHRTVVSQERGFWAPVHAPDGFLQLAPDYRRVGIPDLPYLRNVRYSIAVDPRRQTAPR